MATEAERQDATSIVVVLMVDSYLHLAIRSYAERTEERAFLSSSLLLYVQVTLVVLRRSKTQASTAYR